MTRYNVWLYKDGKLKFSYAALTDVVADHVMVKWANMGKGYTVDWEAIG